MTPLESSILCRASIALPVTATGEMMYMPGGEQTITPIDGGIGQPIKVLVDKQGAAQLEAQRSALVARGSRPYFDFNHSDGPASFWPTEFFYRETPEPGIYCRGEWSASGKASVEGKEWRQFSPVFHVDNKRGTPAHIVCRDKAKPNMGGLVNDPAFHSILPLWAKAGAASTQQQQTQTQPNTVTNMDEQQLAALNNRIQSLETELTSLKAKNGSDNDAEIRAKNAELKAARAELAADASAKEADALKAKNKVQADAIAARNKADAESAVKRAVERGAIAAKDDKTQTALVAKATDDPGFLAVIDAMQGNPALGGRITAGSGVRVTAEAPNTVMKEYAAILCRNAEIKLSHETHKAKGKLALEAAALFAKEIDGNVVISGMPMDEAIKAADNSNLSVGLLAGTLVMQRALPLLQYEFPILGAITSDFSDEPGLFGQTQSTRIVLKPAVQTRSTGVDSAGRPLGWNTVSPAQMVDVPVTLDEHVGVPTVFGENILASTIRNLFAEQAPMAVYALGEYAVNKLANLFTATNYNAYAGTSATGGSTTSGSNSITVASTANMYPGQEISGTGIPTRTYVSAITSGTTANLTQAATATGSTLTFTLGGGRVPTTYATYVKALTGFSMADLGSIKAAFTTNMVPQDGRFALLNSSYWAKLAQDPNFNTFFAAMKKPEIITEGALPKLQGFNPMEAGWFPSANNLVGFAGHRAAAILKSRLPVDITSAVDAQVPGSVTTVSAPGGISVLLVQYVSLREGYAEWRPEVMLGAAVGDRRAGLCITSA